MYLLNKILCNLMPWDFDPHYGCAIEILYSGSKSYALIYPWDFDPHHGYAIDILYSGSESHATDLLISREIDNLTVILH